jgi:hypothetical protein
MRRGSTPGRGKVSFSLWVSSCSAKRRPEFIEGCHFALRLPNTGLPMKFYPRCKRETRWITLPNAMNEILAGQV